MPTWLRLACALALGLVMGCGKSDSGPATPARAAPLTPQALPPVDKAVVTVPSPEDKVLLTIGGMSIRESDLARGIPHNLFNVSQEVARDFRLENLVRTALLREFLASHKITIPDDVVEEQIAGFRKNPPRTCSCCPPCRTLEEFLDQALCTLPEFKEMLRNQLGLDSYLSALWDKEGSRNGVSKDEYMFSQRYIVIEMIEGQVAAALVNKESNAAPCDTAVPKGK